MPPDIQRHLTIRDTATKIRLPLAILQGWPLLGQGTVPCMGNQTYSWEMQGQRWCGSPLDILDAVAAAVTQGIEFSNVMIGDFRDRPDELQQALTERGLELAAFAYARTALPIRPPTKTTWRGRRRPCGWPRGSRFRGAGRPFQLLADD